MEVGTIQMGHEINLRRLRDQIQIQFIVIAEYKYWDNEKYWASDQSARDD